MIAPPRLLYLVSEDWYFLSHRLPMARAAREAGYEVHVATRVVHGAAAIKAEGFQLHPLRWQRGSTNPFNFVGALSEVRRVYRAVKPQLIHQVALWPSIIGSLASIGIPVKRISALAGLGFAFTSDSFKARCLRAVLRPFLRRLLNRPLSVVLIQNPDDYSMLTEIGISHSHLFLIRGSGVDTDSMQPLPEPSRPMTIAYVGRLLADKGLRTLVSAHTILTQRGETIRLLIAGETDSANPASIPLEEIEAWRQRPGVEILGQVPDIRNVWARAHIAVLPSRREGLPKSLLEAAACGRAIVATDVPGCREIALADTNAILVPPDDPIALANAIEKLARNDELRTRFGSAGRQLVAREFSSERIGVCTVALYDHFLGREPLATSESILKPATIPGRSDLW
jgi:glycosyltransferase involved in cell wall biosynthesis